MRTVGAIVATGCPCSLPVVASVSLPLLPPTPRRVHDALPVGVEPLSTIGLEIKGRERLGEELESFLITDLLDLLFLPSVWSLTGSQSLSRASPLGPSPPTAVLRP
jgi:hypothetical protein